MNKSELLTEIHHITEDIQENYPELDKYIDEQPIGMPNENHPKVEDQLEEYLNGLKKLRQEYAEKHQS